MNDFKTRAGCMLDSKKNKFTRKSYKVNIIVILLNIKNEKLTASHSLENKKSYFCTLKYIDQQN